jgi:hypothetical protein
MTTFYFNTGVRPENCEGKLYGRQVWRNGTKQIPFTCEDVPDHSVFMFACDNNELSESKLDNVIVRPIVDAGPKGMLSKFAYFRIHAIS